MEYPETTRDDIEDEDPISIVGKVTHSQAFDDGNELYHLRDAEGNEFQLKIWSTETEEYDIDTDSWYLFQGARGDVHQGDRNLGSNWGNMDAIPLEEPPEFVALEEMNDEADPIEGNILALDIETVSTVSENRIDLDNSDHVELLCIGVGFAPEAGAPGRSQVLFRDGSSADDEAALLERFCDLVEERDPDNLLLFKGDFDLQHLRGRAKRVSTEFDLSGRVNDLFDTYDIVNLSPPGSLEDNADVPKTYWDVYNHTLDPTTWRPEHPRYRGDVADPVVTNKDIPYIGERYLRLCDEGVNNRELRALRELLRHYTVSDIDPLFEMV